MPEIIKSLLRSRAFATSVAALIGTIVVMAVPALEPHQEFLRNAIIALAGLVIGKWGLEDFAAKLNGSTVPTNAKEILKVFEEIVEALAEKESTDTEVKSDTEAKFDPQETPVNG